MIIMLGNFPLFKIYDSKAGKLIDVLIKFLTPNKFKPILLQLLGNSFSKIFQFDQHKIQLGYRLRTTN